ncbi:MAG: hypothetical protein KF861_04305 [Planctomycetaceae bacterium]|nr:hypothetical protein [Planctomycetaceae bacterium]
MSRRERRFGQPSRHDEVNIVVAPKPTAPPSDNGGSARWFRRKGIDAFSASIDGKAVGLRISSDCAWKKSGRKGSSSVEPAAESR